MTRIVALVGWEARIMLRELVPSAWGRRVMMTTAAAVIVVLVVFAMTIRVTVTVRPLSSYSGFLVSCLAMAFGASLTAGAGLVRDTARSNVFQLAPMAPLMKLFVPLGAFLLVTISGYSILALPVLVTTFRASPSLGFSLMLLCALAVVWASVLGTFVLAQLHRLIGGDKTAYVASNVGVFSCFSVLMILSRGLHLSVSSAMFGAVVAGATLSLPLAALFVGRRFALIQRTAEPGNLLPEPDWGHFMWSRLVFRTGILWVLVPLLVAGAFALVQYPSIAPPVLVFLLLTGSMSPVMVLWKHEYECLERLRLAPERWRMKRSLLVNVGGRAALIAAVGAVVLMKHRAAWGGLVFVLASLLAATQLLTNRWVRGAIQYAILAGGVIVALGVD